MCPAHRVSKSSPVSEPNRSKPLRRTGRPKSSIAALGVVRVDPDFGQEYPDGDATSTQCYATLARTGEALLAELERRFEASLALPQTAATALAALDGAGEPLTPSQISERVLVPSATVTATLDLLEHRGWIRRTPNPEDRRSLLIEITAAGRATADEFLPGVRAVERQMLSKISKKERHVLLDLLGRVLAQAAELATEEPGPLTGRRVRPERLG